MPGKHLYEFAVLRVVPRVEREEFLNVGVILYCAEKGFLQVLYEMNEERLSLFSNQLDMAQVAAHLRAVSRICQGRKEGGAIGQFPAASRFRWLTAFRSTVLQSSRVHPGFCDDPEATLRKLFTQMVL